MARTRKVNGVEVELTPEEEAARSAEEAYNSDPQRAVERTEAEESRMVNRIEIKGIDRAQFEALFDHENRIRALENRSPITVQQMKDWVKSRL